MVESLLLILAAFLAGGLNAIAGGGSFLTFPALVFVGVPPIAANATSTLAVFPGYVSGVLGFWPELARVARPVLLRLLALAVAGGVLGALLLLITPADVFRAVVPWLLLLATLLFAFDAKIRSWQHGDGTPGPVASALSTLAVTTYGGYFNGGVGIVLMALFARLGWRDVHVMNGLKMALSVILSLASVVTFALAGLIFWQEAALMMLASTVGGYAGARGSKQLSGETVRRVVIAVGLLMSVVFFLRG